MPPTEADARLVRAAVIGAACGLSLVAFVYAIARPVIDRLTCSTPPKAGSPDRRRSVGR